MALIQELITQHKEVRNRKHENVKGMLVALDPESEGAEGGLYPVIKQWIAETKWFVEKVHEGKETELADGELEQRFRRFEESLRLL